MRKGVNYCNENWIKVVLLQRASPTLRVWLHLFQRWIKMDYNV